ncbi:Ni_hydr_CYTB-domain-containing protein [Fragilariopsis cylindrus CCMP1102]|uniref:Ni_hydr_CYTB-domain-containing protein n=1 Tax=Fragilariopsis cylindrus CCMP1102 TaxID=635003 RepID=A0A1E7FRP8_9STRA|nr:Ni_hydr_CYTB-domain-containing protein [Fragilariopsis cylindrus CCMP1102]|eukprot:OEU20775.1 Ni_hydr_CYTB-domain-containing protein [Fragilariopsis cylindrus CCMP1102]
MNLAAASYTVTASSLHWLSAGTMIGCVGCVLKAQESPKEDKGTWMFRHKSLGLLTGMIIAPRLAYRIFNRSAYKIEELAGASSIEHILAKISHGGLYAFMAIMPASGIAMGYYGGKGLPFFTTTLPGVVKTDENKKSTGEIAKQSYKIHKTLGTYGKYLIPLHAGAAATHSLRGHSIFARINPFSRP